MKRSGPPRRRKPLRSNAATYKAWEQRTREKLLHKPEHAEAARQAIAKDRRKNGRLAKAKEEARFRSGGWCEANIDGVCAPWRHRAHHFHHKRLKSQGGPDTAENLAHICFTAHDWIHTHVTDARALGLIIGFADA